MLALRLLHRAHVALTGSRYSTRPVEFFLAWAVLVWSLRVALPGEVMSSPVFRYMTTVAPELFWGMFGVFIGTMRLVGLVRNGSWSKSPYWRLLGAGAGYCWWFSLFVTYTWAVRDGADDFPMRWVLVVFIYFELTSCYHCGQDIAGLSRPSVTTDPLPQLESDVHVTG